MYFDSSIFILDLIRSRGLVSVACLCARRMHCNVCFHFIFISFLFFISPIDWSSSLARDSFKRMCQLWAGLLTFRECSLIRIDNAGNGCCGRCHCYTHCTVDAAIDGQHRCPQAYHRMSWLESSSISVRPNRCCCAMILALEFCDLMAPSGLWAYVQPSIWSTCRQLASKPARQNNLIILITIIK